MAELTTEPIHSPILLNQSPIKVTADFTISWIPNKFTCHARYKAVMTPIITAIIIGITAAALATRLRPPTIDVIIPPPANIWLNIKLRTVKVVTRTVHTPAKDDTNDIIVVIILKVPIAALNDTNKIISVSRMA